MELHGYQHESSMTQGDLQYLLENNYLYTGGGGPGVIDDNGQRAENRTQVVIPAARARYNDRRPAADANYGRKETRPQGVASETRSRPQYAEVTSSTDAGYKHERVEARARIAPSATQPRGSSKSIFAASGDGSGCLGLILFLLIVPVAALAINGTISLNTPNRIGVPVGYGAGPLVIVAALIMLAITYWWLVVALQSDS